MTIHIPGRDLINTLMYEARSRPEIAELCARARFLDDDDIAAANVPLPWYRKALMALRDRERSTALMELASDTIDNHIKHGTVDDPVGVIVRYLGPNTYTNGFSGYQIACGSLIFMPDGGDDYWVDHVRVGYGAHGLMVDCQPIERGTRSSYDENRRRELVAKNPGAPVVDPTEGQVGATGRPSPLAGLGVRIQRN